MFTYFKALESYPPKDSSLKCLSGFRNLQYFSCRRFRLTPSSFLGINYLRKLVLMECDFGLLNNESFKHLQNFDIICLEYPKNYSHLNFSILQNLDQLIISIYSNNQVLETISPNLSVLELKKYHSIGLDAKNLIKKEELIRIIKRLKNLKVFDIYFVELNDFDVNWFPKLSSIKCLSLVDCSLSKINLNPTNPTVDQDSTNSQRERENLDGLDNLEELRLTGNRLKELNPDQFSRLKQLKCLFVAGNKLKHLNVDTFRHLINLKSLVLTSNGIKHLDDNIFADLVVLEQLCLDNNRLTKVGHKTFAGLANLKLLDLKGNSLERIDPIAFSHFKSLEMVRLNKLNKRNKPLIEVINQIYKNRSNL